jgi:uncharacterized protein
LWRITDLKVSIIVPTLNEGSIIEKTLTEIRQLSPYELIVSDGGSVDDTLLIANRLCHRVITGCSGRGLQMNAGAKVATGDILLFLHADNRLEPDSYLKMHQCMKDPKWIGGAFTLCIESDKRLLKLITLLANIRSKYFGLAYGDQGFFVRKEIFNKMNGFAPIPICEDLDFYQRLKKKGPVMLLKEKAHTSPRRWNQEGIFFTTARNILIAVLFGLGFPPRILTKWYLTIR